jgi:hypothetical protein
MTSSDVVKVSPYILALLLVPGCMDRATLLSAPNRHATFDTRNSEKIMPSEYRNNFDEEDIQILSRDARFMVALDAANKKGASMTDVLGNYCDKPPYIIRNLNPAALAILAGEISNRLSRGELSIPHEWKGEFFQFYTNNPSA